MPTKVKPDPRMANLQKANGVRFFKSEFKRDLRCMDQADALQLLADRLEHHPEVLRSFSLDELLLSVSGIGKVRARQLTKAVERRVAVKLELPPGEPVPLSVRVRDLSELRRGELAIALREHAHDVS